MFNQEEGWPFLTAGYYLRDGQHGGFLEEGPRVTLSQRERVGPKDRGEG